MTSRHTKGKYVLGGGGRYEFFYLFASLLFGLVKNADCLSPIQSHDPTRLNSVCVVAVSASCTLGMTNVEQYIVRVNN